MQVIHIYQHVLFFSVMGRKPVVMVNHIHIQLF
ncbi:hypothetical protein K533_13710 [Salmonella enterica subsp. enterica serovar Cubana str. CVM42234]|nr:hypothetical protein K533_13710 [Salmonella enterica subsp. enterica serovar Cubana str. CVM42234]